MNKHETIEAIKFLKDDKVVILPTDTIYGISTIFNYKNLSKINEIKGSSVDKPLIVLISKIKQISGLIEINSKLIKLTKSKNPTTVITNLKSGEGTIAFRVIHKKNLKKIINKTGPIYSTSANKAGEDYYEDFSKFNNISKKIDKIFFGEKLNNKPSTIIDFSDMSKKR